ncbi:MAG: serine/threonine-protein kinase [Gallionellaceae bacterium]
MVSPLDHLSYISSTDSALEETQFAERENTTTPNNPIDESTQPTHNERTQPSHNERTQPSHNERTQPTHNERTQPSRKEDNHSNAGYEDIQKIASNGAEDSEITRAIASAIAENKQNLDVRRGQLLKSSFEENDLRSTLGALGYRVISYLASGGSADILLAEQSPNNEKVVIKIMDHTHSTDRNSTKLLIQEFTLMSRLDTPHVIRTFDRGYTLNTTFITMEYLAGGTLSARIKKGLSVASTVFYMLQITSGLSIIHKANIIHRDIKPDNIMFRLDDTAVITDFGIAKLEGASAGLTFSGHIVGTPSYLAPELLSGDNPSIQSDLYSMGIMFFEMLVGKRPYRGANVQEIFDAHVTNPIPELPSGLAAFQLIINRLLAKQPGDRYQDCGGLISELKAIHLT